jgi:hypothetical protein
MRAASRVAAVLIAAAALCFAVTNWRWSYSNDGLLIWATKAQVLHFEGGLAKENQLWTDAAYLGRHVTYPHLIPLYEALVSVPYRQFDFDAAKTVFLLFYLSLLLSTYRLARSAGGARLGILATALVSWLPGISTGESVAGYADMPLAAFVTAMVANLFDATRSDWRSRAPWLMASLLMVKSEGYILVAITCIVILVVWLSSGFAATRNGIRQSWTAVVVLLIFAVVRVGNLRWLSVLDGTYRAVTWQNLLSARSVIGEVLGSSLRHLFSFQAFGLFWAAFVVFGVVAIVKGSARQRALVVGTTLGVVAYTATFLFTNWVVAVHIASAYDRILTHLAPLAAVCITTGYSLTRSPQ